MFEYQSKERISSVSVLVIVIAALFVMAISIAVNFRGGNPWAGIPSMSKTVHAATK
jgi:hypothetical protein